MIKAKFAPLKMKTRVVWAGIYFNHYNQIVFFSKKPKLSKEEHRLMEEFNGKYYDCLDNQHLIVGDMSVEQFMEWFGVSKSDLDPYMQTTGAGWVAKAIEIPEVFQVKLRCCWDKYGKMEGLEPHQDW